MGFAHVLKDNMGKPSGYRECDGEVAYMPEQQSYENIFRKIKIDVDEMEILNHDFIKDKQRIYRKGVLLRGITPDGFHVFNSAYIGNHQIIYTPYGDAKVAHPDTFEVLDDGGNPNYPQGYGKDEEFVYFFTSSTDTRHAVRLKACKNPSSFSLLTFDYAKDDQHVYYDRAIVKSAIPQSFFVLDNGYSRDEKHIFWRDQPVKAKVSSFIELGEGYAADEKNIFYHGTLLDVDRAKFTLLGYTYASDGIHVYGNGKLLDTSPKDFHILTGGYACDGKHIFWKDDLLDADTASFKVLEDNYAEDCFAYFSSNIIIKRK